MIFTLEDWSFNLLII